MKHTLKAFSEEKDFQIHCEAQRQGASLRLEYQIEGSLDLLLLQGAPKRDQDLWRSTCFEVFIALPDESIYWELNVSPHGVSKLYRFDRYREGQKLEKNIDVKFLEIESHSKIYKNSIALDLQKIELLAKTPKWLAAVSVVLEKKDQSLSYWALVHRGERPDFHRRDSFIIQLINV